MKPTNKGLYRSAAHRAKFAKKVHKPPLMVNDINFELIGFNEYGSLGVPQTPKSCDALIKTFKFIMRYVNLFVKVSRVCAVSSQFFMENSYCSNL